MVQQEPYEVQQREVMEFPSLEVFKTQLDTSTGNSLQLTLL